MSTPAERRRSSADSAAMRDAMCTRIRKLGSDILSITRAAVLKVEELDAAHELELQQQQQQQQQKQRDVPHRQPSQATQALPLSPRPNVNVKQLRCTKAAPLTGAARTQARPTLQARPASGSKNSAPLVVGEKKKGKSRRSPSLSTNAGAVGTGDTQSAPRPPQQLHATHHDANLAVDTNKTSGTTAGESSAPGKPPMSSTGASSVALRTHAREDGTHLVGVDSAAGASAIAGVCQAAEERYHDILLLDQTHTQQDRREELRNAPLYDLSNAACVCHDSESDIHGGVTLSARSPVSSFELPEAVVAGTTCSRSCGVETSASAHATEPPPQHTTLPTSNYYRVVYIHQSTRLRKQSVSSRGSGYSSSRSGGVRRRGTPLLGSPGGASQTTQEREDDDEPRMVNSYVRAMYAIAEGDGACAGDAVSYVCEGQRSTATQRTGSGHVDPATAAAAVVQVELRVPATHRSCSSVRTMSASRTSTPSTGHFRFPLVADGERERHEGEVKAGAAAEGAGGLPIHHEQQGTSPAEEQKQSSRGDAVLPVSGTNDNVHCSHDVDEDEGEVVAQIETMEGWRRDRRTSVENRIRQRRHSSVVAPGWQGEYYCYASPARASVEPLPLPTHGEGASEGKLDAAGVSRKHHSASPPIPLASDEDKHAVPHSSHGAVNSEVIVSGDGDDESSEGADGRLSPPLQPQYNPSSSNGNGSSSFFSFARAASPVGVASITAAATTYDVLLQTRTSGSSPSSPRSPREGTVPAVDCKEKDAGVKKTAGETATVSSVSASAGAGAGAGVRRRRRPRLEVVVASDYNSMEWAFAGEARRISAASEETGAAAEKSETALPESTNATAAAASPTCGGAAAAATSLWAAHQRRMLAEEEHRRWNARTRQPHGADIHAPIVLRLAM